MISTTLNKIRGHSPCPDGWTKLLKHLGKTEADDEPLAMTTILDSNGLDDALWCLRSLPEHDKEWRLFAVWCARQVQNLVTDQRSIEALNVAERYANGDATREELLDAAEAAYAAVALAAAYADDAAVRAADAAVALAATDAADAAADAAACAADAADAAYAASYSTDAAVARGEQEAELRHIFENT